MNSRISLSRRRFSQWTLCAATAVTMLPLSVRSNAMQANNLFEISLAQWSLHRSFFGPSLSEGFAKFASALQADPDAVLQGELDPLDFPRIARESFSLGAVEYVNTFFFGHADDAKYLQRLKANADANEVQSLLIMCDALGAMGHPDGAERQSVIDRHKPWVDAAAYLGCHAVRVNAYSEGPLKDQQSLVADGLSRLADYASGGNIHVLVENHGGISSDAGWLTAVIREAGHPYVGTLPDFGNFRIDDDRMYDRYLGVEEMMPFAKAVSAKSHDFDAQGNERHTDYLRMLKIVLDAGYRGHVGIEYEGSELSEPDGIRATQTLLESTRHELSSQYATR